MPITVRLRYLGYVAARAGRSGEPLTLPEGARPEDVLDHVAARCGLSPAQRGQLFVSAGGGKEVLADGDQVAVGILIGGG